MLRHDRDHNLRFLKLGGFNRPSFSFFEGTAPEGWGAFRSGLRQTFQ